MNKKIYILNCEKNIKIDKINSSKTRWGTIVGSVSNIKEFSVYRQTEENCICVIPNNKKIVQQFKKNGYSEFSDYIIADYLDKRIVILYGNCHTSVVAEVLGKYKQFTDEFVIYPIKPIYMVKDPMYFNQPIFSICDVFINQPIQINNRYGKDFASEEIIKKLKKDCVIISIPNVYRFPVCFFPQHSETLELKKHFGKKTVFFRDKIIDENYISGQSISNIIKKYHDVDYVHKDLQLNELDKLIEKIRKREEEWDVKAADFILKNYKEHQLFNDPNHPTDYFLKYIAKEVIRILIGNVNEQDIDNMRVSKLDPYEMPLCSATVNNYGLQYKKKYIRETGQKVRNRPMDLEEYVLQYLSMEWSNPDVPLYYRIKSRIIWIFLKVTDMPYLIQRIYRFIRRKFSYK